MNDASGGHTAPAVHEARRDMTDEKHGEATGEAEPLNWACTVRGYRIEGELPDRCPECGADKREFEEVPRPGF